MKLPEPGDVFESTYQLHEVIGEGGFARVFRARDLGMAAREVAIKILKPDPRRNEYAPDVLSRFRREVQVLARLTDPHSVTLFQYGESAQGLLYLVFEFVPGQDLSELLRDVGQLDTEDTKHILRQVLHALREAHTHGLLHRDIKPSNIRVFRYLEDPLSVKLLDFGIAKPTAADQPAITKTGEMVGTPRYMSPEQLTEAELSPASDIYSLGIVALEMLGGSLHGGRWSDQLDRLESGHVFSVPELERIGPGLHAVVMKMCARRPQDRYRSADAVLRALAQTERITLGQAEPSAPSPRRRADVPALPEAGTSPTSTALKRYGAVIAAVAAVALLLAVTLWWWQSDPAKTTSTPGRRVISFVKSDQPAEPPAPVPVADTGAHAGTSPGCGRTPPFVGMQQRSLLAGLTEEASWTTFVPQDYDANRAYPVVLLFHQDVNDGRSIIEQTGFDAVASAHGIVIVAPDDPNRYFAWRRPESVASVPAILRESADSLCLDPERIYAVGHGVGGFPVARLSCEPWLAATATNSFRLRAHEFLCSPPRPIPHLTFAPIKSRRIPVDGGQGCGSVNPPKISLAAAEGLWRDRNRCDDERVEVAQMRRGDNVCWRWQGCEAEFVSCHLDGGFSWPGATRAELDAMNCDTEFGIVDYPGTTSIWEFLQTKRLADAASAPW